jgi:hypothetical protein
MVGLFYAAFAWVIVAIGTLHMFTTSRLPVGNAIGKIWFFGSGLAIALVGALNLLHRSYGVACFGVRFVCRIANVLLLLLVSLRGC